MDIILLCVGKTDNSYLEKLINEYVFRVNKFIDFKVDFIIPPKNIGKLQPRDVKKAEGEIILRRIAKADFVVLLDEKGKSYSSSLFAHQIQKYMNAGYRRLVFVVGGAFGFSEQVYLKANAKISLSEMTTTHQLVRLFFTEQLYRAFTIINGHPYHNE